jgi:hypothetical protein
VSVAAIKMRTPLEELIRRADEIRGLIERHLGLGALPPKADVLRVDSDPNKSLSRNEIRRVPRGLGRADGAQTFGTARETGAVEVGQCDMGTSRATVKSSGSEPK